MQGAGGSIATAYSPAVRAIKGNQGQSMEFERDRGRSREIEGDRTCCAAERAARSAATVSSDSASRWRLCTSTCHIREALREGIRRYGRRHQRSSGAISGHQASSGVIRRHQASSGAISSHQAPSVVIRRHQVSGHQRSSEVIRGNQVTDASCICSRSSRVPREPVSAERAPS
jgi:hypothetical protein